MNGIIFTSKTPRFLTVQFYFVYYEIHEFFVKNKSDQMLFN